MRPAAAAVEEQRAPEECRSMHLARGRRRARAQRVAPLPRLCLGRYSIAAHGDVQRVQVIACRDDDQETYCSLLQLTQCSTAQVWRQARRVHQRPPKPGNRARRVHQPGNRAGGPVAAPQPATNSLQLARAGPTVPGHCLRPTSLRWPASSAPPNSSAAPPSASHVRLCPGEVYVDEAGSRRYKLDLGS